VPRPELPLHPAAGEVQQFAAGLRSLRISAGQPSYRRMSRSGSYSAATLARAASGHSMPSLEVTLAYVAACGGDPAEWRSRWEKSRHQTSQPPGPHTNGTVPGADTSMDARAVPAHTAADPDPAAGALAGTRGRRMAPRHLVWLLMLASIVINIILLNDFRRMHLHSSGSVDVVSASRIEDGTDPKASHCGDSIKLDSRKILLAAAALLGGRQLSAGTSLGTITLKYSARCAGAWARFDPAPDVFHNPGEATVTVTASRPTDGTQTSFHLGRIEQAYGDLLLTGPGCVTATGTVAASSGSILGTAQTRCLPAM
jgi:hypothetical protein